ncbi:MAG: GtrA family protein [Ruminococcaceae bacterium]|nr:GtrA family protein [Oscillospiraceae bacterium]
MKKADVLQVIKFAFVGTCNTVLDYGVFLLLFSVFGWDKNPAQICATGLAMTSSYLVNRYWTFHKTGSVHAGEIGRFILVNLMSLATILLCLNIFYDLLALYTYANHLLAHLGFDFQLEGDTAVLFCKVLSTPFSMTVNFLGNRLWVFRSKKDGC